MCGYSLETALNKRNKAAKSSQQMSSASQYSNECSLYWSAELQYVYRNYVWCIPKPTVEYQCQNLLISLLFWNLYTGWK